METYLKLLYICVSYLLMKRSNYATGITEFLEGGQSDNLFVINAFVERQLTINKRLYVCFIDFSKIFDMIDMKISFNELIKEKEWVERYSLRYVP